MCVYGCPSNTVYSLVLFPTLPQTLEEVQGCEHELNTFKQQVSSGSIGDGAIASLQQMLKNTAGVYRTLRDFANNLQAPIPPDAIVGPYHPDADLDYDTLQLAAADNYWDDFKDEGFRTVNALPPDTRVSSVERGAAGEAATGEEAVPAASGESTTTTDKPATEMMDTAGTVPAPAGTSSWTAF